MSGHIPVYVNETLIERADLSRARRLSAAPNAVVVRARKGAIVRITLRAVPELPGDELATGGAGYTYPEQLGGHDVVILKRYDEAEERFVRWSDRDSFYPRRFNPDLLPGARS